MTTDDDEAARARRQHALRAWHLNPSKFPFTFEEHVQRGDFDHILRPDMPKQTRGAA